MICRERHRLRNAVRRPVGFSTVELLAGLLIMGVIIAIAIIQLEPAVQQIRANSAMFLLSSQLRWARQSAISQRRNFIVQFVGNNEITIFRQEQPTQALTQVSDVHLNPTVFFQLTPGLPDTPDGYGNGGPVVFNGQVGGPPVMQFQSDGTFDDGNGNPINGTVFVGITGIATCGRAVSVLGATGRVRSFKSNGTGWITGQ